MVVDHRHLVHCLQQILAHHLLGPVGVHHHQQAVGVGQQDGILLGEEHILVLAQPPQPAWDISLAGFCPASLMMCTGAPFFRAMAHTPAAAPMQSMSGYLWPMTNTREASAISSPRALGHDPALNLGALLQLLGAAAVELEVELVLDHHLVAAPAQRHVQGQGGEFVELPGRGAVAAEADGEGGGDAVGALYLPDLI